MARMRFEGAGQLSATLVALIQRLPDAVGEALKAEAEIEMTESKRRVPVDTGVLRASGYVGDPEVSTLGRRVSVELGYGGAAADYAVIVHEDLDVIHKVGEAKYLESVLKESAPYMAARIAKRLGLEELAR